MTKKSILLASLGVAAAMVAANGQISTMFFPVWTPADAKEDDAEAIKASGVDFSKAETDEDFSHDRLWSDRTRNW